jgi:hypothetical protein
VSNLGSEALVEPLEEREAATWATIVVLTTAELSECNCPEFCERDHDVD